MRRASSHVKSLTSSFPACRRRRLRFLSCRLMEYMSFNMGSAFTCPTCTHEKTPYPCIYMHSPGSVVLWWLLLTGVSNFCALPSAQQPYQPRPVGLQLPRRLHQQRTWHSRRANNRLAPLKLHAVLKMILCSLCACLVPPFHPCSRPQKHGYENVTKWSCTDVP